MPRNRKPKAAKAPIPVGRNPPRRRRQRPRKKRGKTISPGQSSQNLSNVGQVSVAAAYASGQRTRAPRIMSSRDQTRIIHRELITSVSGTTAFTIGSTFPLNPGMTTTFPWLSTQAQAWERYRFNSLKFEYFTRTGSNVPGSVMLAPDYDAADAAPASEQIASSYEDVAEDAPWKDICCTLRPSALHAIGPTKFIRTAVLPANLDIKTYDAGNFFVCTVDGTAVNWGKLWVEYDVTLFTPQLHPTGAVTPLALHINGAGPTSALILGAQTVAPGSTILATVAGSVITFLQAGKFLVNLSQTTGGGGSATISSGPVLVGGTYSPVLGTSDFTGFGSTDVAASQTAIVNVAVGATITFNNTLVGGMVADLIITALPATLG